MAIDKFERMQRFLLVAQSGSFTRAAEILDLPKSSISSAIQGLEQQLGTRLFHRSTRKITLTQDGEHFLPQCQALLGELEAIESQFTGGEKLRGVLRIDMPSRFASTVVFPHLQSFLDRYPNLQLKISCTDTTIDPVKEGVDCVIRVGGLKDSTLVARPLAQYRVLNCASPAYLERHGEPKTLDDLQHHKLIDYTQSLSPGASVFEYMDGKTERQIEMPCSLTVNSTDAYMSACLNGLGIIQIPKIGAVDVLAKGLLVGILDDFEAAPMPVTMLYPSRRQLPKRVSLFMDWLLELVNGGDAGVI